MATRARTVLGFVAFVGGYLLLIVWFKAVDVYHLHFATAGPLVVAYNAFRVLFAFYLFWIVYGAGAVVSRAVAGSTWRGLGILDRLALGSFAGAGVWHIVLLILGYAKAYTFPLLLALTLPVLALSFRDVAGTVLELRTWFATRRPRDAAMIVVGTIVVLSAITLLIVKGLYPGGEIDYFTHYFYYYLTVIERGDVWPNEVWYHSYYSKGAGLFFLGMILTDPLAPQLVTACFMAAAALVVHQMARRVAPGTPWPLVCVAVFLAAYIYTPTWAQFEKQHELNAALVIAIAWLSAQALAADARDRTLWLTASALTIVAAVLISTPTAIFVGTVFGMLALVLLLMRRPIQALLCVGLAAVAGLMLVSMLAINYVTTGLIDDRGLHALWRFADIEKLDRWNALANAIVLYWGRLGLQAEGVSAHGIIRFLIYSLRLDLLYPLLIAGIVIAIAAMRVRLRTGTWAGPIKTPYQTAILAAMVLVSLAIGLTAGRGEQISFFRYSSYTVAVVILLAISLGSLPVASTQTWLARVMHDRRTALIALALTLATIVVAASDRRRFFDAVLPRAWHFATGTYSLDMAYTRQVGWPNKPWGAIYPGARGAHAAAGPRTRIWSLHATSFCMLPDCRIESVDSFTLGAGWADVMFGSPEDARAALQASGHNYFLFSSELRVDDYLPRSPLFSPDNIGRYFGIRWTDGTTTLLTWLGADTAPLDQDWIATYRRAVEQSPVVQSFPYDDMKAIFARLAAMPRPWRALDLPWRVDRR